MDPAANRYEPLPWKGAGGPAIAVRSAWKLLTAVGLVPETCNPYESLYPKHTVNYFSKYQHYNFDL